MQDSTAVEDAPNGKGAEEGKSKKKGNFGERGLGERRKGVRGCKSECSSRPTVAIEPYKRGECEKTGRTVLLQGRPARTAGKEDKKKKTNALKANKGGRQRRGQDELRRRVALRQTRQTLTSAGVAKRKGPQDMRGPLMQGVIDKRCRVRVPGVNVSQSAGEGGRCEEESDAHRPRTLLHSRAQDIQTTGQPEVGRGTVEGFRTKPPSGGASCITLLAFAWADGN